MPQPMPQPTPEPWRNPLPQGGGGSGTTGESGSLPLDQYVASIAGEIPTEPLDHTLLGELLMNADLDEFLRPRLSQEFLLSQIANVFWSTLFDLSKSDPGDTPPESLSLPFIVRYRRGQNTRFDLVA